MSDQTPPARTLFGSLLCYYSKSRRLEDRIRQLCARAVAATDPAETNSVSKQLTDALHEHVERLRTKLTGADTLQRERRQSRS